MVVFGAGTAEEWHCFGGGRVGFGGDSNDSGGSGPTRDVHSSS
jgi:hypothetical protein